MTETGKFSLVKMHSAEEDDMGTMEPESIAGDDDELDADLERAFLRQPEEAEFRFRSVEGGREPGMVGLNGSGSSGSVAQNPPRGNFSLPPDTFSSERQYSIVETPRESHCFGAPRLTFSFPGWGVDISKGGKHPSIVSHYVDPALDSASKRLCGSSNPSVSSTVSRVKGVEEDLGDRSPVWAIPDEVLLFVMRRLDIRDLCSSVQTCKRWYAVGLQDELWDKVDHGLLPSDSSSDGLPRWVCKKNLYLSENIRVRFNVLSKGYDYLRRALHEWWDNSGHKNSKGIIVHSLMRKLTGNDWSLLYEALGVAFIDRADRIANMLLRELKQASRLTEDGTSVSSEPILNENTEKDVGIRSLVALYENSKSSYSLSGSSSEFEVHWKSGSVKEVSQIDGVVGQKLWELLLESWKRFKDWLLFTSAQCPDLNHEVMVERARSLHWTATPTVYAKGLICFRSQVMLRYRLRNALQAGFMLLTAQDARGCASEHHMNLFRSSHRLLQELDVSDDFALPEMGHTQTKLRQCFRSALSTNSKLALHMNDRLNRL